MDRHNNQIGRPLIGSNRARAKAERNLMDELPYSMDGIRRDAVLVAIREVCAHRGWLLLAAHVRTTHVHLVLEAEVEPISILNCIKAYASRKLNQMVIEETGRKRWARHGSTRWLWKDNDVASAIRYVIEEQGEGMALYVNEEFR
jgi:REP element-mobilizing transposase RayT